MVHCSSFDWARRAFLAMLLSVAMSLSADAQVAALGGHAKAVEMLLSNGARADLTNADGVTAQTLAKVSGHAEIPRKLSEVRPQTSAGSQAPLPRPTSLFAKATEIDVRLIEALNAATAQANDRLEVVTVRPVVTDRGVEIPAGSILTGTISGVRSPTGTNVGFNRFIVNGKLYFVTGGVTQVMDSRGSAIAGVKASSFGDLTSTRGRLELPRGTIFRVRLR